MQLYQETLRLRTPGRTTLEITAEVRAVIERSEVVRGLCHVFIHHTSASLLLCENADDAVRRDLEAWFAREVRDGDPMYEHDAEGPDDMAAHIRSVLTASSITIPVAAGRADLGTWQGLYLFEHRHDPHTRRLTVSVHGALA